MTTISSSLQFVILVGMTSQSAVLILIFSCVLVLGQQWYRGPALQGRTSGQIVKVQKSNGPVTNGGTPCECVPEYQCDANTNTINTDGAGLVGWRLKNVCADGEVCCEVPEDWEKDLDTSAVPNPPANPPPSKPSPTPPPVRQPATVAKQQKQNYLEIKCGVRFQNQEKEPVFKIFNDPEDSETMEGEFPWMLIVKRVEPSGINTRGTEEAVCGATIINPSVALTAAHCVSGDISKFVVRAGEWDLGKNEEKIPPQDMLISDVIIHEKFSTMPMKYDVALVFFRQPLEFNNAVNSICLPGEETELDLSKCVATGWGHKRPGQDIFDNTLKKVRLPIVKHSECQQTLKENYMKTFRLHPSFVCAGGEKGVDTCMGDGGGPLICPSKEDKNKFYQLGITSWGISGNGNDCGEAGLPGVYTNVQYLNEWILHALQSKIFK